MTTNDDVLQYIAQNADQPELLKPIRLAADKAIKAHNAAIKKQVTTKYSDVAYKMALWLWEQVQVRYPYVKEPSLAQWADDIDKLMRCDNQPYDLVKVALVFSQQDDFWRQQVRSGANLRKHYEKILVKAQERQIKGGGTYKV